MKQEQARDGMDEIGEAIHDAFRQSNAKLYTLLEEALAKGVPPKELKRWVDRFAGRNGQGLTENAAHVTIDVMVHRLAGACCCPGCQARATETGADGVTRYCAAHWRQKSAEGEQ